MARIDFNTADLNSLIRRIETITDPRDPRGVRHGFATTLVLIACATLAGNKSLVAISEWCDSSSQEVLCRLGARISPGTGLRIPPSYATIRRATMAVDADHFDRIINTWAQEQSDRRGKSRAVGDGTTGDDDDDTTDPGSTDSTPDDCSDTTGADLVGVAVDGKAVRGVLPDSLDDRVSAVGRDRVGGARPNDQSRLCGGASGAVKPASRAGGRCS